MIFIDTHTHLYSEQFDLDRDEAVERAISSGVEHLFLPAVDHTSNDALFDMARCYPSVCHPMIGIHPTSINEFSGEYLQRLDEVAELLKNPPQGIEFCAIGEIGLDLYWDKGFLEQQIEALNMQIELALEHDLAVVVHTRDAWEPMRELLEIYRGRGLRGIMHGFSGSYDDYAFVRGVGDFMFGAGGPVTYKKSPQAEVIAQMDVEHIVLETDAPYLTPVPFRGKRNESSYIPIIAERVAQIKELTIEQLAQKTTANALRIFNLEY